MKPTPQQQIQRHYHSKQLKKAFKKEDNALKDIEMKTSWLKDNKIKKDIK